MNINFPNTTLIHGSISSGIGKLLNAEISWQHNENPWSRPGGKSDNQTHLVCLTNNATLQQTCCGNLGGKFVETNGTITSSATASNGGALWCALPQDGTFNDHYNTQPQLVTSWATCYNTSVNPSNNPGVYSRDIKNSSDVWQCELTGNFSGASTWEYPIYASAPTSGASVQVGRGWGVLVVAVVAVAASSLAL